MDINWTLKEGSCDLPTCKPCCFFPKKSHQESSESEDPEEDLIVHCQSFPYLKKDKEERGSLAPNGWPTYLWNLYHKTDYSAIHPLSKGAMVFSATLLPSADKISPQIFKFSEKNSFLFRVFQSPNTLSRKKITDKYFFLCFSSNSSYVSPSDLTSLIAWSRKYVSLARKLVKFQALQKQKNSGKDVKPSICKQIQLSALEKNFPLDKIYLQKSDSRKRPKPKSRKTHSNQNRNVMSLFLPVGCNSFGLFVVHLFHLSFPKDPSLVKERHRQTQNAKPKNWNLVPSFKKNFHPFQASAQNTQLVAIFPFPNFSEFAFLAKPTEWRECKNKKCVPDKGKGEIKVLEEKAEEKLEDHSKKKNKKKKKHNQNKNKIVSRPEFGIRTQILPNITLRPEYWTGGFEDKQTELANRGHFWFPSIGLKIEPPGKDTSEEKELGDLDVKKETQVLAKKWIAFRSWCQLLTPEFDFQHDKVFPFELEDLWCPNAQKLHKDILRASFSAFGLISLSTFWDSRWTCVLLETESPGCTLEELNFGNFETPSQDQKDHKDQKEQKEQKELELFDFLDLDSFGLPLIDSEPFNAIPDLSLELKQMEENKPEKEPESKAFNKGENLTFKESFVFEAKLESKLKQLGSEEKSMFADLQRNIQGMHLAFQNLEMNQELYFDFSLFPDFVLQLRRTFLNYKNNHPLPKTDLVALYLRKRSLIDTSAPESPCAIPQTPTFHKALGLVHSLTFGHDLFLQDLLHGTSLLPSSTKETNSTKMIFIENKNYLLRLSQILHKKITFCIFSQPTKGKSFFSSPSSPSPYSLATKETEETKSEKEKEKEKEQEKEKEKVFSWIASCHVLLIPPNLKSVAGKVHAYSPRVTVDQEKCFLSASNNRFRTMSGATLVLLSKKTPDNKSPSNVNSILYMQSLHHFLVSLGHRVWTETDNSNFQVQRQTWTQVDFVLLFLDSLTSSSSSSSFLATKIKEEREKKKEIMTKAIHLCESLDKVHFLRLVIDDTRRSLSGFLKVQFPSCLSAQHIQYLMLPQHALLFPWKQNSDGGKQTEEGSGNGGGNILSLLEILNIPCFVFEKNRFAQEIIEMAQTVCFKSTVWVDPERISLDSDFLMRFANKMKYWLQKPQKNSFFISPSLKTEKEQEQSSEDDDKEEEEEENKKKETRKQNQKHQTEKLYNGKQIPGKSYKSPYLFAFQQEEQDEKIQKDLDSFHFKRLLLKKYRLDMDKKKIKNSAKTIPDSGSMKQEEVVEEGQAQENDLKKNPEKKNEKQVLEKKKKTQEKEKEESNILWSEYRIQSNPFDLEQELFQEIETPLCSCLKCSFCFYREKANSEREWNISYQKWQHLYHKTLRQCFFKRPPFVTDSKLARKIQERAQQEIIEVQTSLRKESKFKDESVLNSNLNFISKNTKRKRRYQENSKSSAYPLPPVPSLLPYQAMKLQFLKICQFNSPGQVMPLYTSSSSLCDRDTSLGFQTTTTAPTLPSSPSPVPMASSTFITSEVLQRKYPSLYDVDQNNLRLHPPSQMRCDNDDCKLNFADVYYSYVTGTMPLQRIPPIKESDFGHEGRSTFMFQNQNIIPLWVSLNCRCVVCCLCLERYGLDSVSKYFEYSREVKTSHNRWWFQYNSCCSKCNSNLGASYEKWTSKYNVLNGNFQGNENSLLRPKKKNTSKAIQQVSVDFEEMMKKTPPLYTILSEDFCSLCLAPLWICLPSSFPEEHGAFSEKEKEKEKEKDHLHQNQITLFGCSHACHTYCFQLRAKYLEEYVMKRKPKICNGNGNYFHVNNNNNNNSNSTNSKHISHLWTSSSDCLRSVNSCPIGCREFPLTWTRNLTPEEKQVLKTKSLLGSSGSRNLLVNRTKPLLLSYWLVNYFRVRFDAINIQEVKQEQKQEQDPCQEKQKEEEKEKVSKIPIRILPFVFCLSDNETNEFKLRCALQSWASCQTNFTPTQTKERKLDASFFKAKISNLSVFLQKQASFKTCATTTDSSSSFSFPFASSTTTSPTTSDFIHFQDSDFSLSSSTNQEEKKMKNTKYKEFQMILTSSVNGFLEETNNWNSIFGLFSDLYPIEINIVFTQTMATTMEETLKKIYQKFSFILEFYCHTKYHLKIWWFTGTTEIETQWNCFQNTISRDYEPSVVDLKLLVSQPFSFPTSSTDALWSGENYTSSSTSSGDREEKFLFEYFGFSQIVTPSEFHKLAEEWQRDYFDSKKKLHHKSLQHKAKKVAKKEKAQKSKGTKKKRYALTEDDEDQEEEKEEREEEEKGKEQPKETEREGSGSKRKRQSKENKKKKRKKEKQKQKISKSSDKQSSKKKKYKPKKNRQSTKESQSENTNTNILQFLQKRKDNGMQ